MIKILTLVILCFNVSAHEEYFYPGGPLEIIKIGHPTLKKVAKEVDLDELATEDYQLFLDDMIETMKNAGGVGLAAPQVNVSERVFVMKPSFATAEVIVNPKIEYIIDKGKKRSREGCLSIPGKRFVVRRYKQINLSYFDRYGEYHAERAKGFRAIVAQHEYDHLNGTLISDWLGFKASYMDEGEVLVEEDFSDDDVPLM